MGYCYGSLFYETLTEERHNTKMYGERVMKVTAKTFQCKPNELPENITDMNRNEHKIEYFQHSYVP